MTHRGPQESSCDQLDGGPQVPKSPLHFLTGHAAHRGLHLASLNDSLGGDQGPQKPRVQGWAVSGVCAPSPWVLCKQKPLGLHGGPGNVLWKTSQVRETHMGISSGACTRTSCLVAVGPPGKVTSQGVGNDQVQPSGMGWAQCSGDKAVWARAAICHLGEDEQHGGGLRDTGTASHH